MQIEQMFLIVWFCLAVLLAVIFMQRGRKALRKFPRIDKAKFEYVENSVSAYSKQSNITKMGGARNVLQLRVTKDQLWLTTNVFFAWVAEKFDLLHIIPIESICSVESVGKNVVIVFEKERAEKEIVLISRKRDEFVELLNSKIR